MRTLIVLVLILSSCAGGLMQPAAAESPEADPVRIDAVIENAEVVSEAPLVVYVEGYFPADCDMPANYEVEQWGNEVRVSIYQVALSDTACHRQRVPYHETLPEYLFADLTPDTYYLDINGYALRVHVRDLPPTPVPLPTPFPPPRNPPPVQWIERDLCVGDLLGIEPFSPTNIYHSINVTLQDVTRQQGEIVLNYVRGQVRLRRETSHLLAYRSLNRAGNLTFEALRPGEVTGEMRVLTESISPYGYQYMLLAEYRIHIIDCDFPPPPPPDWIRSYAVIQSANVIVLESYPLQLQVHVRGYYSQPCYGELHIDQWRERNRVYVEMYHLVNPMIMCPDVLTFFDKVIPLEGSFTTGRYTIHVNDYELDVDL